ncbi:MAG: hypothetical protein ACRETA_04520 [Gammaproteobacteria bacterium]
MFQLRPVEYAFYAVVVLVIAILLFPDFFGSLVDGSIAPAIDRLAENWLHDRGLVVKEEELDANSES